MSLRTMIDKPTPYQRLGGESRVRELVDRFYDYMEGLQEAATIRGLHARSLKASREKLFLFLSGWLGGPDLYVQKYGHPMLRRRHLPFPIGDRERDQWMLCMQRALADMDLEPDLERELSAAFRRTADHMRNRAEGRPGPSEQLQILPRRRS
jgi:hemoglobin